VVLNPVRAKVVPHLRQWTWSSTIPVRAPRVAHWVVCGDEWPQS
jgi:hypothetical protein